MTRFNIEKTRFNGFYIMDSENSESGYVIIGVSYPDGYETLIDPKSISDDFSGFSAEKKPIFDCGLRVCHRYDSLQEAYFAYLQAAKGVV